MWWLALLLGACVGSDQADSPTEPGDTDTMVEEPRTTWMVVAGTFDDGGMCCKSDHTGCDLYLIEYDLSNYVVLDVTRLTDADGADTSPAIEPERRYVLYQREQDRPPAIHYVSLETLDNEVLVEDGLQAYVSLDGTLMAYRSEGGPDNRDVHLRSISFDDNVVNLGAVEELTDNGQSTEPMIFTNNDHVALYQKTGEVHDGQTIVHGLGDSSVYEFSEPGGGCAHGSVNYEGSRLFCQQGMELHSRTLTNDGWSEMEVFPYPDPEDPTFAGCDQVTAGHAEFCGDSEHVLAVYSCKMGEDVVVAHTMLFQWGGPVLARITDQVEEFLGVEGAQSYTGMCTLAQ
ncbi:MAG: hypothetical protein HN348_06010 [Proteobacteria bacterium]|jgi:hypothetical protein|nr:hypothetical protein [Pseudomonadota bacterium]